MSDRFPIVLNNQSYTSYPNGTAGDHRRAVEFRVMLRGADAPPVGSGPFRITIEPQPPPVSPGGHSGPAEPTSPAQESSGPETASAGRSGAFSEMANGPELGTTTGTLSRDLDLETTFPVDGVVVNGVRYVREQPEEPKPDPLEGLPPLAEGSRWVTYDDGTGVESADEWITTGARLDVRGRCELEWADVRHLLARHDREHGIETHGESDYQIDRFRALSGDLLEPWRHGYDPIDTSRAQTEQRIAHRILAIIDDLRERGVA